VSGSARTGGAGLLLASGSSLSAGHHGPGPLGRIPPGQAQEQQGQAAAEQDERHLGPEDGTEYQRGQGGQDDSGQLRDRRCAVHLEAARRRRAATTG
jgi:hypothetical protein